MGAGYDSTYFWIKELETEGKFPALPGMSYFEVDYPEVVQKKIKIIKDNEKLSKFVWDGSETKDASLDAINAIHFKIFGADLRNTERLSEALSA